jgi:hypothetical protein
MKDVIKHLVQRTKIMLAPTFTVKILVLDSGFPCKAAVQSLTSERILQEQQTLIRSEILSGLRLEENSSCKKFICL